jgi:hypothetical protein
VDADVAADIVRRTVTVDVLLLFLTGKVRVELADTDGDELGEMYGCGPLVGPANEVVFDTLAVKPVGPSEAVSLAEIAPIVVAEPMRDSRDELADSVVVTSDMDVRVTIDTA